MDGEKAAAAKPKRILPLEGYYLSRFMDGFRYTDHLCGRELALEHRLALMASRPEIGSCVTW